MTYFSCVKCKKGELLQVSRAVETRISPPDSIAARVSRGLSPDDYEIMTRGHIIIQLWKCSNPECEYEVR